MSSGPRILYFSLYQGCTLAYDCMDSPSPPIVHYRPLYNWAQSINFAVL